MRRHLTSGLLDKHAKLSHAFTTRHQGVSHAPYHSNNIAFHVGDDDRDVLKNHKALATHLSYDLDRLVHMRQIHSDQIVIVDEDSSFDDPPECDALITDIKEKPLMVMTADCTPVLLYDPVKEVIAAIHAGRAGAFKDIVTKSIVTMHEHFGSEPADILSALGPSIGVCCYEVDEKIDREATLLGFAFAIQRRDAHYFLDVNMILRRRLEEAGIRREHIEDLGECNACHNGTFFSYRADGQRTGRMAGIIALKR